MDIFKCALQHFVGDFARLLYGAVHNLSQSNDITKSSCAVHLSSLPPNSSCKLDAFGHNGNPSMQINLLFQSNF